THMLLLSFLFHDTATPQTYTLSLHDALPIWTQPSSRSVTDTTAGEVFGEAPRSERPLPGAAAARNTVAAVTTANASEVLRRRRPAVAGVEGSRASSTLCAFRRGPPRREVVENDERKIHDLKYYQGNHTISRSGVTVARRSTTSAILLDQHPLWLDALERVVEDLGVRVAGKTTDPEAALGLVSSCRPDLLILGIEEPVGIDEVDCVVEARAILA